LFNVLAVLKRRGVTLLYVSHRLDEVFQIADTVTVLRDGQQIRTSPLSATTPTALIAEMLGRPLHDAFPPRHHPTGEVMLSVEHLSGARVFEDVSFQLRAAKCWRLADWPDQASRSWGGHSTERGRSRAGRCAGSI
jgi:ABC-type sugar transport system ATPase subunit